MELGQKKKKKKKKPKKKKKKKKKKPKKERKKEKKKNFFFLPFSTIMTEFSNFFKKIFLPNIYHTYYFNINDLLNS